MNTVMNETEYRLAMHAARQKVARVAMADLLGASTPPDGMTDNYPFNACAWRDYFTRVHEEWYDSLDRIIDFVYHNERIPDDLS